MQWIGSDALLNIWLSNYDSLRHEKKRRDSIKNPTPQYFQNRWKGSG